MTESIRLLNGCLVPLPVHASIYLPCLQHVVKSLCNCLALHATVALYIMQYNINSSQRQQRGRQVEYKIEIIYYPSNSRQHLMEQLYSYIVHAADRRGHTVIKIYLGYDD
jgi:hypothetical protein